MKVLIKVDGMFLKPGVASYKGVVDTEKLGVKDARVKKLLETRPGSIELYKEPKKGEEGSGDQQGAAAPQGGGDTPVKKEYDDITVTDLKAFMKGKVDEKELETDDKRTLYTLYEALFSEV